MKNIYISRQRSIQRRPRCQANRQRSEESRSLVLSYCCQSHRSSAHAWVPGRPVAQRLLNKSYVTVASEFSGTPLASPPKTWPVLHCRPVAPFSRHGSVCGATPVQNGHPRGRSFTRTHGAHTLLRLRACSLVLATCCLPHLASPRARSLF